MHAESVHNFDSWNFLKLLMEVPRHFVQLKLNNLLTYVFGISNNYIDNINTNGVIRYFMTSYNVDLGKGMQKDYKLRKQVRLKQTIAYFILGKVKKVVLNKQELIF